MDSSGKPHKVGDTKVFKDSTWYYCDCPNHRDGARWHTFKPEDCRTRKRWLSTKEQEDIANIGEGYPNAEEPDVESNKTKTEPVSDDNPPTGPEDLTSLLANAMNMVGSNDVLRDILANSITQADQM